MKPIMLNSINDISRQKPGLYSIPFKSNGRTFNFLVNIGNIDENASMTLQGYGQGGTGRNVLEYLNGNSNNIDVIVQSGAGGNAYETAGWQDAVTDFMTKLSNQLNLNQNNTVLTGFSLSAEMTAKYAAHYARSTGANNFCAVITESSWGAPLNLTESERKSLIENNVTIFNVYQNNRRSLTSHVSNTEGVHIIDVDIRTNTGGDKHILPYYIFMQNGIDNIANGEFNFANLPHNFNFNGQNLKIEYIYTEHYVDENGNYVSRKLTADQVQELVREMFVKNMENLYEKNSELSSFANTFNKLEAGTSLASNLSFVSNSVNDIKGKLVEHNKLNYTKESNNEAGIIGSFYGASNYFGAITNKLYGNISTEADAVYSIANAIYKMDGFASVMAESSLTDSISSMFATSNTSISAELEKLKSATSNLFDTAKNAVMADNIYNEISAITGLKLTEGKVGRISASAIKSAVNAIIPSLNNTIETSNNLKNGVDSFISGIGNSNILQGGVWNDVKSNLTSYQSLLNANVKAASFIEEAIQTAMGIIIDYMGDDPELDDSKLPTLREEYSKYQSLISDINGTISSMSACKTEEKTIVNDDGEEEKTGGKACYTDSEIQSKRNILLGYNESQKSLEDEIKKLEGLAPVVQAAQEIIQSAIDQVKSMYEKPVKDANGNISFNANFNLDLSPYANYIDTTKNYKQLLNDYYEKIHTTVDDVDKLDENEDYPTYSYYSGSPSSPAAGSSAPEDPKESEEEAQIIEEFPTDIFVALTEPVQAPPIPHEPKTGAYEKPTILPRPEPFKIKDDPKGEIITYNDKPITRTNNSPNIINLSSNPLEEQPEIIIITEPSQELNPDIIIDDYSETNIIEPIIHEDNVISKMVQETNDNSGMKKMGISSAIGLAVGATGLAAHTVLKNKDEDENEDFGYSK